MGRGKLEERQGVILINAPHFCLTLNLGLKSPFFSTCFCFVSSQRAQAVEFRAGRVQYQFWGEEHFFWCSHDEKPCKMNPPSPQNVAKWNFPSVEAGTVYFQILEKSSISMTVESVREFENFTVILIS